VETSYVDAVEIVASFTRYSTAM